MLNVYPGPHRTSLTLRLSFAWRGPCRCQANPSGKLAQSWVRSAGQAMSGAAPFLQWRVGKWVANNRGPMDPDGRFYDPVRMCAARSVRTCAL